MKHANLQKNFLGKNILVITAHPDDESYVAAGTIHKNHQAGGSTHLLCATLGEKGASHLKKPVTIPTLKAIRKKELTTAARCLHISGLHITNFPDGNVAAYKKEFQKKAFAVVKRVKPEYIISFGPDGISGHNDHIAVGGIAKRIAIAAKVPFAAFALPPRVARGAHKWLFKRRKANHYSGDICFARPNFRIAIDPSIKVKALRCHASQMDDGYAFTGFPEYAVKELLKAEYFVL